jgi:hypothetical protein
MGHSNDLTTCFILPPLKIFNQKHCLRVGQKHHPKVGKKTILVILDLLKSTFPKKPKWFFDPLSLWGVVWFENLV